MTVEQFVAILVAITGLLGAFGLLIRQISELRADLNGRMQELLDHTRTAAMKEGELAGRDYTASQPKSTHEDR